MAKNCDCAEPVAKDSALDVITRGVARDLAAYCREHGCSQREAIARLGAKTSTMLSTRVPNDLAKVIRTRAAIAKMPVGKFIRRALARLDPRDAAKSLADIIVVLGLPPDTAPGDVVRAIETLLASSGASPVGETAYAPAPAALSKKPKPYVPTLSAKELAACKARGLSPADFLSRKAKAVRRSP